MDQGSRSRIGWGASWWRWGHSVIECCEFGRDEVEWIFDRAWPVLLPCQKCRVHYCRHVRHFGRMREATRKHATGWRERARRWLIDVHNAVNKHLGKKALSMSEAKRAIKGFRGVRYETPFVVATVRTNLRRNRPDSGARQRERLHKLVDMLEAKGFTVGATGRTQGRVDRLVS